MFRNDIASLRLSIAAVLFIRHRPDDKRISCKYTRCGSAVTGTGLRVLGLGVHVGEHTPCQHKQRAIAT